MKVKELIERLQSLNPDLEVYIANREETQLTKIDFAIPCVDYGEDAEEAGEEFVAIFPKSGPRSPFTLTAEDVEELKEPIQYFAKELDSGWLKLEGGAYMPAYTWNKAINNLLARIKQWEG